MGADAFTVHELGTVVERPDANPKSIHGIRKPAMGVVPPSAMLHLSDVLSDGAEKYGAMNWRTDPVAASVYYSAAMRHLMAWWDGEDTDPGSRRGAHHLAAVLANMAIVLDAMGTDTLIDDRPITGPTARMIEARTDPG